MSTPTVAIVGRPNVGKSTLFNRLVGERRAIVHNEPGVTRDRIVGAARLDERPLTLIDTGGLVPGDDPLGLNRQVLLAAEESDLLLLMVDGREGLVAADRAVWDELRRLGRPTVLVVNKLDTKAAERGFAEFYALGIEPLVTVSAEHGLGFGELVEAILAALPPAGEEPGDPDAAKLAIVGRPNVGKSSLLNRLLGEERVLVSPTPGTTRDPIDTRIEHAGRPYLLIDTAGIRRRSKTSGAPEELAVMMARRQVERADLAVLVLDAQLGVTSGDLAIAGAIWELGRSAVVVVNKWDLLDEEARERLESSWPRLDEILAVPERINASALTGRGVEKLFGAAERALERWGTELPTAQVNALFEEAFARHRAPSVGGKPFKVLYATQVSTRPPTFLLFANRKLPRTSPYRRYLENFLRRRLSLAGVPIRLAVRRRE